jgi:hypothetical protein
MKEHRCQGMYAGMTRVSESTILLVYKCAGCGEIWGDKVSRDEANTRHPHLAGDATKCSKCSKWHKPEVEEQCGKGKRS